MPRASSPLDPASAPRIVFLTRDPVVHQQGGSTTYALALLELLRAQGAEVTLVATVARSRSPRLFFRAVVPVPAGVEVRFPGYARLFGWYVRPWSPRAWARMLSRLAVRRPWLQPLGRALQRVYGDGLYTGAWDLTLPTAAEAALAKREAAALNATAVVGNYCIWGPVLAGATGSGRQTAILMHDLLSARVRRFAEAGLPLDTPTIAETDEMQWLSGAGTVLAAQESEAGAIRDRVRAEVVVTPIALRPRALDAARVEAGRCLFVGSNILPNRTGLEFLLGAVWPRVRAAVPGATLAVAGTVGEALGFGAEAQHQETMGVLRLGLVPSLEDVYAQAAVCLVPLRLGTGIKIKLLEGLAFGKAIVSTEVGIQGLERWAHNAMRVADEPEAFAGAIISLLTDETARRAQEQAALHCAEAHFGAGRTLDPAFVRALLSPAKSRLRGGDRTEQPGPGSWSVPGSESARAID